MIELKKINENCLCVCSSFVQCHQLQTRLPIHLHVFTCTSKCHTAFDDDSPHFFPIYCVSHSHIQTRIIVLKLIKQKSKIKKISLLTHTVPAIVLALLLCFSVVFFGCISAHRLCTLASSSCSRTFIPI